MQCTKTSELSSHSSPKKSGIITIEYVLQQRLFKRQKKKRMSQCRSQFNTPQERGHSKSSPGSFSLLRFKIFLKTKTWKETIMFFPMQLLFWGQGLKKRDLQPQQEPHYPHWLCTLIHLFICSFPQEMGTKMQVSGQLHLHWCYSSHRTLFTLPLLLYFTAQPAITPTSLRLSLAMESGRLSKCRACPVSSTQTTGPPAQSLMVSQLMHSGQQDPAGKLFTLLTDTLWGLCSCAVGRHPTIAQFAVARTHHCHQNPAVKWPSACAARCLRSILKQYVPHLLQRDGPNTSIPQAGSGLGPWAGSLRISSA